MRAPQMGDDDRRAAPASTTVHPSPPAEPLPFGRQLQRRRVRAGWSQEQLAERAGLSLATIGALEQGRRQPHPHTVAALAEALGLAAEERAAWLELAGELAAPSPRPGPSSPSMPAAAAVVGLVRLPVPPTPLIGRQAEVAQASALLDPACSAVRLLTLTGPGGVGKTRLALAVAAALADAYPDGVIFVDLAPLRDHRLVAATVARALDLRESGGRSVRDLLLEALRERQVLLLLDNFEHLLAAAPLLAELLTACPGLALLVTSRSVLRLRAERRFSVEPLAPPDDGLEALAAIAAAPAVRLFVDRAQTVVPAFVLDATNAHTVAAVCRRLEGMPLAIELAAARAGLLGPEALLRRLERRLPLLTDGARDLPERQQTLRTTLAWSHDLLEPAAQVLFRQLAVFVGGFTLEAAEAVCADAALPVEEVLDGLQVLVDSSLVRSLDDGGAERRYGMLETIREHGVEQVVQAGEAWTRQARHFQWCLALAEAAEPALRGPWQDAYLAQLEVEQANLRAALGWALAQPPEADDWALGALRLAGALARYWAERGSQVESTHWLELALAAAERLPRHDDLQLSAARAKALLGVGWLYAVRGEFDRAQAAYQESLALYRARGDRRGMAAPLLGLAHVAEYLGHATQVHELLAESRDHATATGDDAQAGEALCWLARARYRAGETAAARTTLAESMALLSRAGDRARLAGTLFVQGVIEAEENNQPLAEASFARCRELYQQAGDRVGETKSLGWLGYVTLHQDRHMEARVHLTACIERARQDGLNELPKWLALLALLDHAEGHERRAWSTVCESVQLYQRMGCPTPALRSVEIVGYLLSETPGRHALERAARLFGAADTRRRVSGLPLALADRPSHTHALARVRAGLAAPAFSRAWTTGQALSLEQALADTLAAPAPSRTPGPVASQPVASGDAT